MPPFSSSSGYPSPVRWALPVRWVLALYRGCASMWLAVVLIGAYAAVCAWATFVEGLYGPAAASFGIYGAGWFAVLGALLALNVLCAALIRFPWKRHQIGFLVTHGGLLVLLFGCLLTWWLGQEAQLPIFEGHSARRAFEESQHFELAIERHDGQESPGGGGATDESEAAETVTVPFISGPFNWYDYRRLSWFPWHLVGHDRGVIYDHDGIRLEVLDYYSDSTDGSVPRLILKVCDLPAWRRGLKGLRMLDPWRTVTLAVRSEDDPHAAGGRPGLGSRVSGMGEERIVFWVARNEAETEAFRKGRPEGPLGRLGQVVLHAGGEESRFSVEEILGKPPVPLGETGLQIEVSRFVPGFLGVEVQIHAKDNPPHRMVLLADFPEFNRQDDDHGVYGCYWFDATQKKVDQVSEKTLAEARRSRVDIIQGHDGKLYRRAWKSPRLGEVGELPADGAVVTVLRDTDAPVALCVEHFEQAEQPGKRMVPRSFDGQKSVTMKRPQARVRLTIDGKSEEFWLAGTPMPTDPKVFPTQEDERRVVDGTDRRVAITLERDEIDLGFQLHLDRFEKKLVSGSSQASHYSSWVDLLDPDTPGERLKSDVEITLNAPVDFWDRGSGRSYRLYQSSYRGPWRPGDPWFDELAGGTGRDYLFLSWLTVNYDPGRGVKYAGCLLIVIGITIMFYMKAYFFRPRGAKKKGASQGESSLGLESKVAGRETQ